MWAALEASLNQEGIVEYGIFQQNRRVGAPIWRRHGDRGKRFETLSNALLNPQGARKACKGQAHYPKVQYSATQALLVPYVATWLRGSTYAYLVRASSADPEITIVPVRAMSELSAMSENELCEALSEIFERGAAAFGICMLTVRGIR